MKRQLTTMTFAIATIATTTFGSLTADACDRRGGGRAGYGGGFSYGPSRTYRPPAYAPIRSRTVYAQPQPICTQPQALVPQQPVAPPQMAPQQVAPQPATVQSAQPRPISQPQVAQQPVQQVAQTQTMNTGSSNTQPAPAATNNAEASALKLLGSLSDTSAQAQAPQAQSTSTATAIPQFTAASSLTSGHVGTWKVALPGNQSVELVLNGDSTFRWTATKNGRSSTFNGQFRLEEGRLTLVRSSDLQQMAGNWNGGGSNFTFKLDGATNAGLNFTRS